MVCLLYSTSGHCHCSKPLLVVFHLLPTTSDLWQAQLAGCGLKISQTVCFDHPVLLLVSC